MNFFLMIFCFILFETASYACGCDKPLKVADLIDSKAPVFEGVVEEIRILQGPEYLKPTGSAHIEGESVSQRVQIQEVIFSVFRRIRGEIPDLITVRFAYGVSSCHLEPLFFKRSQKYLLSVYGYDTQSYKSNYCSLRTLLKKRRHKKSSFTSSSP